MSRLLNEPTKGRRSRHLLALLGTGFFVSMMSAQGLPATEQAVSGAAAGDPIGSFDGIRMSPGGISVTGWALDPDSTAPLDIHVYIDGGSLVTGTADETRPDIGAIFPAAGEEHGFDIYLKTGSKTSGNVCAYALNKSDTAGSNVLIGCKDLVLPNGPIGSFDLITMAPNDFSNIVGIWATGWIISPRRSKPTDLHIYANGVFAGKFTADIPREDIGMAFSDFGEEHGFDEFISLSAGTHEICVYAIGAPNTTIGCKTATLSSDPISSLDLVTRVPGGIRAAGWAIDPDTSDSIPLHFYVDGAFIGETWAEDERSDIENVFPEYGPYHGFDVSFSSDQAPHNVCIYAISQGQGANTLVGCRII